MLARAAAAVPLVLCLVSFVLTTLALFAGHKKGFMEDYAIIRLNTSQVGHGLFEQAKADQGKGGHHSGIFGDVEDAWDKLKGAAKDELNEITADIADKVANGIGISQWYSVHIMDACEGNFSPNATAKHSSLHTTNCTGSSAAHRFNLTHILDHELKVGPFNLNLAKIDWPDSIQDKLDDVNGALLGLFVVYALGVGFSGLAMLLAVTALIRPDKKRIVLINFVTASLGALFILIGSIIVTVVGAKGAKEINHVGGRAGVSAVRGTKLFILTWVSSGCMIIASGFWVVRFFAVRKQQKLVRSKETY